MDDGLLDVRLGEVRVKQWPTGLENLPCAWARNRRKATVIKQRNPHVTLDFT